MVIYEVNLTISTKVYSKFIIWLDSHIKKMLQFDGFIDSTYYKIDSNNINQKLICIHYKVDSKEHLDKYLSNNAYKMKQDGIDLFNDSFKATRRILFLKS